MKIRGVSLEASQAETYLLKELLSPINLIDYFWYRPIDQEEVWSRPEGKPFFTKDIYTGNELKQLISSGHFVVFLRLEAYFHKEGIPHISTFTDFSESSCQIILLIYDCERVQFYTKDVQIARDIYTRLKNKFKNVNYITDENDLRTGMNIL